MSLRLRLVLVGALAIVFVLGLSALGLGALFGTHVERRATAEMSAQLDRVLSRLDLVQGQIVIAQDPGDARYDLPYSGYYWEIEVGPQNLRSRSLWDWVLEPSESPPPEGGIAVERVAGPQDQTLLVVTRAVVLPQRLGGGQATAMIAVDADELVQARRAFLADLSPYITLLALVLIAAGWIQITLGLRPLKRLSARVASLHDDSAERMGTDWPGEVAALTREMDGLLDARASDLERARLRAGDLAHGLKTPLQALMGEAARLRAAGQTTAAEGIEEVIGTMRRTVDRELARARRQADPTSACSNLHRCVAGVVSVLGKTPDGGRIDWRVDIPDQLCVALDKGDLVEALGAVLENAARHARTSVTLRAALEADYLHLEVVDDGPGIPAGQRDAMLARFARLDERGSGMGLAITSEIVRAAGGDITLSDAQPGLRVVLSLRPCAGPDDGRRAAVR
jgi:signal transduction histidine kinase